VPKPKIFIICILISLLFNSCNQSRNSSPGISHEAFDASKNQVRYAHGFNLTRYPGYTKITVFNPWKKNDTLASYVIKKYPVRVVVLSTTFLGMFDLIGECDKIIASTDPKLIYNPGLYQRYVDHKLVDLGEAVHPNVETIISLNPDLVMKYIYESKDMVDEKISMAGIQIAYNLEFMETHPLGRAEWIKFVAAFMGDDAKADSIFTNIERSYLELSSLAGKTVHKPTVLDGSCYKGIWYAAGGKSFPAKLYADAGADYYWKDNENSGSIPLNLEVIIEKQADAEYWIGSSTGSKKELLDIESRYALLKAFQTGKVYHFGKRVNPNGGLDYYESGVVHPDILLKDLIRIFHPELLPSGYQPVYLQQVE
jgi:iron complex transport system substrate-binding protein